MTIASTADGSASHRGFWLGGPLIGLAYRN